MRLISALVFLLTTSQIACQSNQTSSSLQTEKVGQIDFDFANFPDGWNLEKQGRMQAGVKNEKVLSDPYEERSGKVLEVNYPKGTASPAYSESVGLASGGTQFIPASSLASDAIQLSYWFRFAKDFDCVKGGKMPGVASTGEIISGGELPTGTNGFSVRLMWREDCKGEVYAYIPKEGNEHLIGDPNAQLDINSKTGKIYGWSLGRGSFSFPKDKWVHVVIDVRANAVGKNNGGICVRLDSKEIYRRQDLVMRTTDALKLGRLFFSTFFGGSSESYAARKDERIYFSSISLHSHSSQSRSR